MTVFNVVCFVYAGTIEPGTYGSQASTHQLKTIFRSEFPLIGIQIMEIIYLFLSNLIKAITGKKVTSIINEFWPGKINKIRRIAVREAASLSVIIRILLDNYCS